MCELLLEILKISNKMNEIMFLQNNVRKCFFLKNK